MLSWAWREVAAGDSGNHIRYRHAGTARAGYEQPQESHVLLALPGRTFSALQLICIMYAGSKRIEPRIYIVVDLSQFISTFGAEEWDEYPARGDLSRRLVTLKARTPHVSWILDRSVTIVQRAGL